MLHAKTTSRPRRSVAACRRAGIVAALALSALLAAPSLVAAEPAAPSATAFPPVTRGLRIEERREVPLRRLRGYGALSARFARGATAADGACSWLAITCEDARRAAVLQAKYLADLRSVGGVVDAKATVAGRAIAAVDVPDQGLIAAVRVGATVTIVAAEHAPGLSAALAALGDDVAAAEPTSDAAVPMFLDEWDRYGFRFYYSWLFEPKPGTAWRDYHVLGELDFAKKVDAGIVLWANADMVDAADGLTNQPQWDWVARAAGRRGVPVVINTMLNDAVSDLNRHRDETQLRMPGYCGGFYMPGDPGHAGTGHLSWCAGAGLDDALAALKPIWASQATRDATIEYLEPHGELRHGEHDLLTEYGPVADRSYRAFLRERYGTVDAVAKRWATALRSWDQVRVPELAHFFGGDDALDLGGEWRVRGEDEGDGHGPIHPAPAAWYAANLADTGWPAIVAPQSDQAMFMPLRRPMVWRRHFTIPAGWRATRPRVWLYVFSLNRAGHEACPIVLDGATVAEPFIDGTRHWTAVEVGGALADGKHVLALRLPEGFLGYRCFLSTHAPAWYPALGDGMNAQWADFVRWQAWTRADACRRGIEAIREVDRDRSVICMAPYAFIGGVESVCRDEGGHFHDTGAMAGWWNEMGPLIMRANDLPFTAEPGNPVQNVYDFKNCIGNWLTEGVDAVHYFMHIGDVYWHDDIRTWFEAHRALIGMFGKMHVPKARFAMLYGDDVDNLLGWPWGGGGTGYVRYQFNVQFHQEHHIDGLTPGDFANGVADPYHVVLDTNSCVMDPSTVDAIAAWVKRGGVFITTAETGRHTPEHAEAWPIESLTGYHVTRIAVHPEGRELVAAPGQAVFDLATWPEEARRRTGLVMSRVADGCSDLLLWPDGAVAVGMRHLGRGLVVEVGAGCDRDGTLVRQLLRWLEVERIPGYAVDGHVTSTHEVSNNGLFDVWVLFNSDRDAHRSALRFRDGLHPASCRDVDDGHDLAIAVDGEAAEVRDLDFASHDVRILATPRRRICQAPLDWFDLQCGWWRESAAPRRTLPPRVARDVLALTGPWRTKPLADGEDAEPLGQPGCDDHEWASGELAAWTVPDEHPYRRAIARMRFRIPEAWRGGTVRLWHMGWHNDAVVGRVRGWLDGKPLGEGNSLCCVLTGLEPGSTHLLALAYASEGEVAGPIANAWLVFTPEPRARVDLAGDWDGSRDALHWGVPVHLPGAWTDLGMARRTARVPALGNRRAMLRLETTSAFAVHGVMINGHYVRRLHHDLGLVTWLDVTPWIKAGADNEIRIVRQGAAPGSGVVTRVSLDLYDPGDL